MGGQENENLNLKMGSYAKTVKLQKIITENSINRQQPVAERTVT